MSASPSARPAVLARALPGCRRSSRPVNMALMRPISAVLTILVLPMGLGFSGATTVAKESHYEQVRALLVVRAMRCTTCHESAVGRGLNIYGQRVAAQPANLSWSERFLIMNRSGRKSSSVDDKERGVVPGIPSAGIPPRAADGSDASGSSAESLHGDVDGDGVADWVEILAGSSPADKSKKPDAELERRVKEVVSCRLCHAETGRPGKGLEANPHNDLGKLLAKTIPRTIPRRPATSDGLRAAAERTPIIERLSIAGKKRPAGSRATWWEKMRLLYEPANPKSNPMPQELSELRRQTRSRVRRSNHDLNSGFDHPRHRLDGFLKDGETLK